MSEHPDVDLDALRENANQIPMYKLIGMQVVEVRPGYSKFRLPFRRELTQPMGVMHGGAFASVADSAVAIALWGLVGTDKIFTTIEMKINFIAPVASGEVIAEGNIVYGGLKRVVQRDFTQIRGRSALLQANAVYRSANQGRSWEAAGLATYTLYVDGPLDYLWYDEPFMCVVPHRFWVFTVRVDLDGFARIIRSPDQGKTWEPIIKTPVWGYPQHLRPLRDGRLLMTYGYRRPPWGIRACLSRDHGKTWRFCMTGAFSGGLSPVPLEAQVTIGLPTSIQLCWHPHNGGGS